MTFEISIGGLPHEPGRPIRKYILKNGKGPFLSWWISVHHCILETKQTYKSVLAAQAAALIAWTTVQHGDRIGGVLMANDQVTDLKPKASRRGALSMINALSRASQVDINHNGPPQLNRALQHLNAVVHPGSLVFMFSDFYDINQQTQKFMSRIRQHNDVVACQLLDPIELEPPTAGRYVITDGRNRGNAAVINTSSTSTRRKYRKFFIDHQTKLKDISTPLSIPVIKLVNGENMVARMTELFGK